MTRAIAGDVKTLGTITSAATPSSDACLYSNHGGDREEEGGEEHD